MGRKKSLERSINDYLKDNQKYIPKILDALLASAIQTQKAKCPHCSTMFNVPGGGNTDAQKYLIDRHFGKPKQSLEVEAKHPSVSGDDLVQITELMKQRELALLETGFTEIEETVT